MTTATRSTDTTPSPTLPIDVSAAPHRTLVFTRIIDATTKAVFEAWINPQHLAKWWGPKGFTNPVCELDARPGGAILIHMCGPDGGVISVKGTFHEIGQNQRIIMTTSAFEDEDGNPQIEGLKTITFEEYEGKTKLTVQEVIVKATPEMVAALDGMEEVGSKAGSPGITGDKSHQHQPQSAHQRRARRSARSRFRAPSMHRVAWFSRRGQSRNT
jgi:uncharacterized protein YndB with AHSA1/START domain